MLPLDAKFIKRRLSYRWQQQVFCSTLRHWIFGSTLVQLLSFLSEFKDWWGGGSRRRNYSCASTECLPLKMMPSMSLDAILFQIYQILFLANFVPMFHYKGHWHAPLSGTYQRRIQNSDIRLRFRSSHWGCSSK